MKALLDTNICVFLLNRSRPQLTARLSRHDPADVSVSIVSAAELRYGAEKSARREEMLARLDVFFLSMPVALFDQAAVARYGAVRADLERRGTPIGPLDTLIAAHALSLGASIVTNNVREFRRVAALDVEDWTK